MMEERNTAPVKMDSKDLAYAIVKALYESKADDIKLIHVEQSTIIADYYVICGGRSTTQVGALSDLVEEKIGKLEEYPAHIEGRESCAWVLLDYSTVIVHILGREAREFYNLERLWDKSNIVDISDFLESLDEEI